MKKKNTKQMITLKDIATITGYSINTVSRALRDKNDISLQTKEKIKTIAEEMGYVNNMIASSLRLGYTNTIAVILGDVSNPHFAIMMKEIEEQARELGYFSFLINTNEDNEIEFQAIQTALNKNVDGIIICPTQQSTKNIQYLKGTGVPFVLIGRYFKHIKTDYVICNDELGGYQASKYLLDRGHTNILMLNGPEYISSAQERLAGYYRAFEESGHVVREELIREIPIMTNGCAAVLDEVFEEQIPFTAIFAFSDIVAWTAWVYLIEHGYRVPKDYSLIGFDNIQSRLPIPYQLSTISSYKSKMSSMAINILVKKISDGQAGSKHCTTVIDTNLVKGETVRPLIK